MAPDPGTTAPASFPRTSIDSMDLVTVKDLAVWTVIGVYPHERTAPQEVRVNLWIGTDTGRAGRTDAIEDAIDYGAVSTAIRTHAESAGRQLVEALAEDFADIVLETFGARAVRVNVEKLQAIPGAEAVGVTIVRHAGRDS